MHSELILRNLDSLSHDIQLHVDTVHCTVPGASAQTEEVHEEEIESGVEEKEEEEGEEQEDGDAEEIFQE